MFNIIKLSSMEKIKQIEIAKKAKVSKSFISRILNPNDPAKPSWDTAKRLSLASKIPPNVWADKDIPILLKYFRP
ncbi:MAG: hypothetical protein CSA42_07700 [Gammaproteobacteria bacterium]|nr:MAG: hypothetical protein CSA42_07700 [Gammaproteobacteria bacterium]